MEISGDLLWFGGAVYSIFIHKSRRKTEDFFMGKFCFQPAVSEWKIWFFFKNRSICLEMNIFLFCTGGAFLYHSLSPQGALSHRVRHAAGNFLLLSVRLLPPAIFPLSVPV